MSIWGKIIGGVAGFAIGGPLGALLGVAAGHAVDRTRRGGAGMAEGGPGARQAAFTVAVIVLSAKMAKSDGTVSRDEIKAFKQVFHIPAEEMGAVGKIFDAARQDAHGFEPYARQVAQLFAHEPAVLEELLGGLFHIAQADGAVHPAELEYLRKVAAIFGLDDTAFGRTRAGAAETADTDPYAVLGLTRDAGNDEIKQTYRKLIREYHPDTLIAKGLPQEFVDLANEKMSHINAAYDRIEKERGL